MLNVLKIGLKLKSQDNVASGDNINYMNELNTCTYRPIIVDCPPFNENSGGAIVLHTLVDQLRKLGVDAYAISLKQDYADVKSPLLRTLKRWNRRRRRGSFKTHPSLNVPLAPKEIIEQAIVVYPETRSGNPLQSPRVVRWLLHKPGFFGVDAKIGPHEEIFYFQPAYAEGLEGIPNDRSLTMGYFNKDIYKNLGLPRSGACRMIRKGKNTKHLIPKTDNAILLDGKSHTEVAHIFSTTEIFYCHDPYTTYVYYAVLCGCVPVVIPQLGLSSTEWRSGMDLKYGIAYGEEEIDWARETSDQLISYMADEKERDTVSVLRFLNTLRLIFD